MATQHSGDVTLSGGVYDRKNQNTFSCETATFHSTHLDCSRCDNQVLHNRYFQPCDLIGQSLSWMGWQLQESMRSHASRWILASANKSGPYCRLLLSVSIHRTPRVIYCIGNTWYCCCYNSSCFTKKDRFLSSLKLYEWEDKICVYSKG